jgi:EAL domain-containing protein (putative c-di-GMP-specific phosphodiesterase class I)
MTRVQRLRATGVDHSDRDRVPASVFAAIAGALFSLTVWITAANDWPGWTESSHVRRLVFLAMLQVAWAAPASLALLRWSSARHRERTGLDRIAEHHSMEDAVAKVREREEKAKRVRHLLDAAHSMMVHFQPIVSLVDGTVVEVEALSRFSLEPSARPDAWFREAHALGMGVELELHALGRALDALPSFPPRWSVAVNLSATTIASDNLAALLAPWPAERLCLELTEHEQVHDYEQLRRVFQPLRDRGVRLGVDDAGAGFSSMHHILELRPDFVKLDRSITSRIDRDPAKRALAGALVSFAREIGAKVIAEGVETENEVGEVIRLGADFAQGYYFDRPSPRPTSLTYVLPVPSSR